MRNTRGFKNNNPGNLVLTQIAWAGKVPKTLNTDGHFEQFRTLAFGVRALIVNLRTTIGSGKNTLEQLLKVYAPEIENNTSAYIKNVCKWTGIAANAKLGIDKDTLLKLTAAIVRQENGSALTEQELSEAWALVPPLK